MINKLKKILYSVLPIFTIQFKEFWEIFKDSWLKEYITNWLTGLLAISILFLMIIITTSFVFWQIPRFDSISVMGDGAWFFRALFVFYSVLVLGTMRD